MSLFSKPKPTVLSKKVKESQYCNTCRSFSCYVDLFSDVKTLKGKSLEINSDGYSGTVEFKKPIECEVPPSWTMPQFPVCIYVYMLHIRFNLANVVVYVL